MSLKYTSLHHNTPNSNPTPVSAVFTIAGSVTSNPRPYTLNSDTLSRRSCETYTINPLTLNANTQTPSTLIPKRSP